MKDFTYQDAEFWSTTQLESFVDAREAESLSDLDDEPTTHDTWLASTTWWGTLLSRTITLACLLTMLGAALYHIWSQSQAIQLGFQYSHLLKERKTLQAANVKLNLAVAKLCDLQRLHRIARQELGMQQPQPSHIISEVQVRRMLQTSPHRPKIQLARAKTNASSSDRRND